MKYQERSRRKSEWGLTAVLLVAVVFAVVVEVAPPMTRYAKTTISALELRTLGTHLLIAVQLDNIKETPIKVTSSSPSMTQLMWLNVPHRIHQHSRCHRRISTTWGYKFYWYPAS